VQTADSGACTYDFGLLSASGTIVWHTGNQTAAALGLGTTGYKLFTFTSQTIPAGKYYVGLTTNVANGTNCAKIAGASTTMTWYGTTVGITAGGTLNNITPPGDIPTMQNIPVFLFEP
jgi:hypothetical protein